jgi:hypothetical protein
LAAASSPARKTALTQLIGELNDSELARLQAIATRSVKP